MLNYQMQPPWSSPYQQQAPLQRPSIPGRMISSTTEVMPNEVPMDGSVGAFIMNDFSALYLKSWGNDGTIKTVKYVPEAPKPEKPPITLDDIFDRIKKIEELCTKGVDEG